jgi:ParB family transcriptional regulator, chromosome partitioning protein
MTEKRRLGKGLGALIPEVMAGAAEVSEIALENIEPNPFQPRQTFNQEKLKELAISIKEYGVIQAVVLSPAKEAGKYYLVAGERRCRAAKIAGLSSVPAVVKTIEQKELLEIALIENLQREDLNPVEEAKAFKRLMQEFGYTQEELAKRLGKGRPTIANSIRLLSLPEQILEYLNSGEITAGQARPLLSINDPKRQHEAASMIVKNGLSAREVEKLVAKTSDSEQSGSNLKDSLIEKDPLLDELQLQIQRNLGTKVIFKKSKNGGTIEIYYYSDEDLERLVGKLLPEGL